jgi:small subunit ribosomal protein S6
MAEVRIHMYEGHFLLNQQAVSGDFGATVEFVREVFKRAEAELLVLRKWEDRKLAYEISGQKRGIYLLAYFKARGSQIANIERDCNLSEQVLRCLIIRADHIGETELELARKDADLSLEAKLRARTEDAPKAPGTEAAAAPAAAPAPAPAGA